MTITATLQAELDSMGQEGQDLKASLESQNKSFLDALYPEPTIADVMEFYERKRIESNRWRFTVFKERERRYENDKTPEKWQKSLQNGRRVFTRLTHNEIMRQVAQQVGNRPRVTIKAAKDDETSLEKALRESRWSNELLPALERQNLLGLRGRVVDGQNEGGMAAIELFLRENTAYDQVETLSQPQVIFDPKVGVNRPETAREVNKRVEASLISSKCPIGARYVDGVTLYYEYDDDELCEALIVELKPFKQVRKEALKRGKDIGTLRRPDPGTPGQPADIKANVPYQQEGATGTVETYRYYDKRWYVWIVGNEIVEIKEHGMPGVPVVPFFGFITSSPNMHEAIQGICWGMAEFELTLNDLLTLLVDMRYRYSRPKLVIETPDGGSLLRDDPTRSGRTLNLSSDEVEELMPGQKVSNVLQGFQMYMELPEMKLLLDLWQRNGLNPISQGESPGADAAGYTVNALSQAANTLYSMLLKEEAKSWGKLVDFVRKMIRDTIRDRVFLEVPKAGRGSGTEWLGLGPDDISDTPSQVKINPYNPTQQIAVRQSLMQANKQGYIPRYIVQTEGFDCDDPQEWDDEIAIDIADANLLQSDLEQAMQIVHPAPPPLPGPDGMPAGPGAPSGPSGVGAGAIPAQPQPPTVGAGQSAASRTNPFETRPGPAAQPASSALAGQARTLSAPGPRG